MDDLHAKIIKLMLDNKNQDKIIDSVDQRLQQVDTHINDVKKYISFQENANNPVIQHATSNTDRTNYQINMLSKSQTSLVTHENTIAKSRNDTQVLQNYFQSMHDNFKTFSNNKTIWKSTP
jgi:hypothetical protein